MSLCLIASVQTSLTTPVHLCKILYVPLHTGFPRKKDIFPLCNIKLLCISLLPVYFIKVLQNYSDLLRYNWDLETLSFEWLLRVVSKFTVCKRFCQIYNFYAIWQKKTKKKHAIKVQSEVIGTTSGSCLFGFCTFYVQSFHIRNWSENIVIFSLANLYVVR